MASGIVKHPLRTLIVLSALTSCELMPRWGQDDRESAQSMQTALTRSCFGTRVLGYSFNRVGVPDDVNVGNDPLAFDPVQMRA